MQKSHSVHMVTAQLSHIFIIYLGLLVEVCPIPFSPVQRVAIGPSSGWSIRFHTKQASNKLASGLQIPCWMVKTWTTSQRCTFHMYRREDCGLRAQSRGQLGSD